MSKYINADELKQKIPEVSASVFGCDSCSLLSKWEVEEIIDEMPSADIVEVVRCKDCDCFSESAYAEEKGHCKYLKIDMWELDFCSYGERKDNDK